MNRPIIHLTPPHVSPAHIQEKIICIRAHRERIFRTEPEHYRDKLIVHNYGQAGAGWTFLFGCVRHAFRQFEHELIQHPHFKQKPITVIGAGCYGLLSAIMLARAGYNVRIIAKQTDNLPSHKAAGFFFPRPRRTSTPDESAIFISRGIESYRAYLHIIKKEHPFLHEGAKLIPLYCSTNVDPGFAPYSAQQLMPSPRLVSIDFGTGKQYNVMEYQTLFIDAQKIMSQLEHIRSNLSIPLIEAEVETFDDIHDPIIFNCAGLGAKQLTGDRGIIPVQGHLITLKDQPPRDQLRYMVNVKVEGLNERGIPRNDLIYYAPKESGILGITFLRGHHAYTDNLHEFDRLIARCRLFFGT